MSWERVDLLLPIEPCNPLNMSMFDSSATGRDNVFEKGDNINFHQDATVFDVNGFKIVSAIDGNAASNIRLYYNGTEFAYLSFTTIYSTFCGLAFSVDESSQIGQICLCQEISSYTNQTASSIISSGTSALRTAYDAIKSVIRPSSFMSGGGGGFYGGYKGVSA